MSLFDQPQRKVHHNISEDDVESCFRPISEDEPFEFSEEETEEIIECLHNFKELAKAGYIELEPETLKMLDQL